MKILMYIIIGLVFCTPVYAVDVEAPFVKIHTKNHEHKHHKHHDKNHEHKLLRGKK